MSKYYATKPKDSFCNGHWEDWSKSVTDIFTNKTSGEQCAATMGYELCGGKVTKRFWNITSTNEVVGFDDVEYIS